MEFDFPNRNDRIYKEDVFADAVHKYLFKLRVQNRILIISRLISLL